MKSLIITRHEALVEFLEKEFGIVGEVISHATADAVRGNKVIGVLPLHLAAEAAEIVSVDLNLPAEMRGKELTYDDVRKYYTGMHTYVVTKKD